MEQMSEQIGDIKEQAREKIERAGEQIGKRLGRAGRGVGGGEHEEGEVTKAIEYYTSQLPSASYLTAALTAMGVSALLHVYGRRNDALFVGQWAPAFLIMGLYNKLVRVQGSE